MNGALLRVSDLRVTYKSGQSPVQAVRGVSFAVNAGQVLAIIGGSGAGKSSIARALPCLHDHRTTWVAGEVSFSGKNIFSMSEKELDRLRGIEIGMIFQDPRQSLDPAMKVEKQVAEAIRVHRAISGHAAREEAREMLADVGIGPELMSIAPYAHQLSSGLCQRAMIAIALAGGPKLLIADEPTGSLDLTRQAQIIALLMERLRSTGLGMIFITHDLGLAAAIADDILVLFEGEAVDYGPRGSILNAPQHPHTSAMLAAWRDGFAPVHQ